MKPVIPVMSHGCREVAESIVPADEVNAVYRQYADALRKYIGVSDFVDRGNFRDPPNHGDLDGFIREALVALAKAGVKTALTKMSWISYAVLSDEYTLEPEKPELMPAYALHERLHSSEFYLTEFRRLKENESKKTWTTTVQSPDGGAVVQTDRVFPMWGIEHENRLDNYQKAKAWYRLQLKERGIVK